MRNIPVNLRFFANVGLLLSVQVFARALNFLYILYLAKYVGAEDFGYLNFVLSVVIIFDALADIGLGRFLLREASVDIKRGQDYAAAFLPFRLAAAAVANLAVVLLFLGFGFTTPVPQLVLVTGCGLYLTALASVLEALLQSQSRFSTIALAHLSLSVAQVGFGLSAMASGGGVISVAAVFVAANIAYVAVLYTGLRKAGIALRMRRDLALCLSVIPRALPYALVFGLFIISARVELIVLGWFHAGPELGVYGVAARMMDAAVIAPLAVGSVLAPRFIQFHREEGTQLADLYAWAFRLVLLGGFLGAVLSVEFAAPIMSILLSRSFEGVEKLIVILFAAYPFVAIYYLNLALLLGAGEQRHTVAVVLSLVTSQSLLGLSIIPVHGATGAATAFCLSSICAAVVSTAMIRRKYASNAPLLRAAAPAVLGAAPCLWLTFENGLAVDIARDGLGLLLYAAISLGLMRVLKLRNPI
ncbi:O-antigen/teichoic acid export membrane protein [Pararhizobium capsulatum DSM 1112]|uniref:O-antigen/teichoic acid export membrane protein n=1 Tax=Pararhizobium capsulatum DSM 1112 TaxID=1121113 RepID=A0ABU0BS63_9HYPH|nr:oligosaccharide flippase family protein [Pararhizobium capsulatum]MDQ0321090.1 O-antigen/teichoic acid export membrane protein [Pararhizobium capsulatum DSM 1112]